jgi:hypothetical protein
MDSGDHEIGVRSQLRTLESAGEWVLVMPENSILGDREWELVNGIKESGVE